LGSIGFDLDGTLIDARERQVGVAAEALAQLTGQELDGAGFWRAKRAGATTLAALTQLGYGAEVAEEVAGHWGRRVEDDDWVERDRALPGARRVLTALRAEGWTIIVLTARRRAEGAGRSLRAAAIASLVDHVEVADPRSAVADKGRALARLAPAGFIGDTDSDGRAALAAGIPFAAVSTGQRSRAYLERRGFSPSRSLAVAVRTLVPGSLSAFDRAARISAT
jgi:phosphoglycolate phosphatase-like HAD superfamily hydrolase